MSDSDSEHVPSSTADKMEEELEEETGHGDYRRPLDKSSSTSNASVTAEGSDVDYQDDDNINDDDDDDDEDATASTASEESSSPAYKVQL